MPYKDKAKQRAYSRMHYKNNKQKYLDSNSQRRKILKDYVNEIKSSNPCKDCKIKYPYYVMDFDHLRDKSSLIKKFVSDNNRRGLDLEISKCDLVCANCHRRRTYKRTQANIAQGKNKTNH